MIPSLEEMMEAQFIMKYYGKVSYDEFNELPLYEFREQMRLLAREKKRESDAAAPKGNINN